MSQKWRENLFKCNTPRDPHQDFVLTEETWPRRQAGRTAASPRHRWPFENTETSSIAAEAATTNPPSGFSGQEMFAPPSA